MAETEEEPPATGPERVACVAVINNANSPLYLRVYRIAESVMPTTREESLEFQMQSLIYNSLDVIEERMNAPKMSTVKDPDGYLGPIAPLGALSIYGHITNTNQKIIVALKATSSVEKDAVVKSLLRKIHVALVSAYLNPFLKMDSVITSPSFIRHVDTIAQNFG